MSWHVGLDGTVDDYDGTAPMDEDDDRASELTDVPPVHGGTRD